MQWKDPPYEAYKGLLYERDDRTDPDPDDARLELFEEGWRKAVGGEQGDFGETAFQELSWHDLGYRLGLLFGATDTELQEEMYWWCVRQMRA